MGGEAGSENGQTEPFLSGQNSPKFAQICPNYEPASVETSKFVRISYQGYLVPRN